MNTKPICVIYLPENYNLGNRGEAPMELMKALNGNFGEQVPNNKIKYSDYWKDYYWFSFYKIEITEPEFNVFYEKDFTEIQFQELKDLVLKSIEEQKSNQLK